MANSSVTAQIHQPLDVHGHLASKIAFNNEVGYRRAQIRDFGFCQIFDLGFRSNARRDANLLRTRISDPENSRQCNHDVLIYRYIYACYSSHLTLPYPLTLTLLVPRIGTDHTHNTFAPHNLAVSTHFLY